MSRKTPTREPQGGESCEPLEPEVRELCGLLAMALRRSRDREVGSDEKAVAGNGGSEKSAVDFAVDKGG